jgi:glycosyltransferase involved in cell wall biosynthesis
VLDVVLPALNEAEALPWVLERMPPGARPIVVDNGSTDATASIASGLGAVVVQESEVGFGAACWAGLRAAEAEVVAFMDADASLDPRMLPRLVERLDAGADLVVGARIAERGAWPPHARFANRVIAWEFRRRTGLALTDLGPMRVARREPLLGLGLRDRRFGWPFEMVLAAARAGWCVEEVPVPYLARTGESKVTGTVRGTARAVRDLVRVLA